MFGNDPFWIKAKEEALRTKGIEGAKKVSPDKERDKRFFVQIIVLIASIVALLLLIAFIPFWK